MGYTILVDTHPDGEMGIQLADQGVYSWGTFRDESQVNKQVMKVIFAQSGHVIMPDEQIIFSLLDDDGDVAESTTVSVVDFIQTYKGSVGALIIRPKNPANQAQEIADIRELIDWALEDGDRVAFAEYTEKLNALLGRK